MRPGTISKVLSLPSDLNELTRRIFVVVPIHTRARIASADCGYMPPMTRSVVILQDRLRVRIFTDQTQTQFPFLSGCSFFAVSKALPTYLPAADPCVDQINDPFKSDLVPTGW